MTCDPVSMIDSHRTPSRKTEAAQRGPISPGGRDCSVLRQVSVIVCVMILFLGSAPLTDLLGQGLSSTTAPGCPLAGAAASLEQLAKQPAELRTYPASL